MPPLAVHDESGAQAEGWPYDYSVPGAVEDYLPQTVQTIAARTGGEA